MFTPSRQIIQLLHTFSPALTKPALAKAATLICGVILSPGRRTVASALRAVGLHNEKTFGKYHRLLSRDTWSAMTASQLLLALLVSEFIGREHKVEIVVDETLERRRGRKIAYKSWFRDPVRSAAGTTVTCQGIRWLTFCLLAPVPWSARPWALPFCTLPICTQKNCQKRGRLFRGTVGMTIDILLKVRQWLGRERPMRLIADGGFTNIELMQHCISHKVEQVGRLRLDAALYEEPQEQPSGKRGRKPAKGARQPGLAQRAVDPDTVWQTVDVAWYGAQVKSMEICSGTGLWHVVGSAPARLRWVLMRSVSSGDTKACAAFFSTDTEAEPEQILACYARRWNIEVFFEEVRAWLGFEKQRGWCNSTIGRSTPCLFGVFSLVTVLARRLFPKELPIRQSAWYKKEEATFRDALSAVREHLWCHNMTLGCQNNKAGLVKRDNHLLIPTSILASLQEIAYYAA